MSRVTRLSGRLRRAVTSLAAGITLVGLTTLPAATARAQHDERAVIQYTEYGIPHITAHDYSGLGYGYGYAAAKDNLCVLADAYLTVNGERSRYLGPQAPANPGLGVASDSLTSDLYFQRTKDSGIVDKLARQTAPTGPEPEVRLMVRGYTEGYNRYLRETGRHGISDPACRGKAWVRPITALDVYRHVYAITTVNGTGGVMDGITKAQPPGPSTGKRTETSVEAAAQDRSEQQELPEHAAAKLAAGIRHARGDGKLGSNAIGVGSQGTTSGRSVLLGNPHYPWQGPRRFWQSQLTIPGKLNVSGAGLLGFPAVMIGHNDNVAWSHTVATAATYGLYEVPLVPGRPTSYLVDGKPEKMTSHRVRVRVRGADGALDTVQRTLWDTRYGPVISAGPGSVPLPWGKTAYTVRDANASNLRALNTWMGLGRSKDTGDVQRTLSRSLGVPWVNTIATDRRGTALYADIQVVPHVTDDLAKRCNTPLGAQIFPMSGVSVLDGGRGDCAWGRDTDAVAPGILGPRRLPALTRTDYVTNANDSPWLANPRDPLTGYPRGVGDINTPRSARTQETILTAERRLAGTDGLPGKGFTGRSMARTLFSDHSRVAQLAAGDTAKMCRAFPGGRAPSSSGPVGVGTACRALAAWDGRYTLDSRGSLLFERFVLQAAKVKGGPWQTPFDPKNPIGTPNTLATQNPDVQRAFGDAVAELKHAGIAFDAPLGSHQYVTRDGARIPVHGGPNALGVLNVLAPVWDPKAGHTDVTAGSSFLQITEFTGWGTPRAATLLTYSQSSDPTSAHHSDQTKLFSRGEWVRERFTQREILASPKLATQTLTGE
ncbi:acyl-homoserine-lactone acylase [Streptomyces sp. SceaMP-e96]|uniref:penicillin acylase family protein n=1 Tax=Streptomyces TaxID=1883 RepID=UPI000823831D|nr:MULTISPECIES: penicillin acylase family protein [unclassified Streptomyces]MYT16150.1 penicillin acylase family protein [Streptomyces sp. SID4951]SCK30679.1 acyl-homoserine-lactone acylase [Streptomyces sp. SceaMP-e96]